MTSRTLPRVLAVLLVAGSLLYAGCGGSEDDSPDQTTTEAATEATTQDPDGGQGPAAKPLDPPEADESIEEARRRIEKAISSGDCEEIDSLALVGRETPDTYCDGLKTRLGEAEATKAEAYDDLGGVIDFERGARSLSAVLVVDRDGLFHIFLVDTFLGEESVGTKQAPEFDKAAKKAVDALANGDCDAFLRVAYRRSGPGASRERACDYAEQNPIANILDVNPGAELDSYGGNENYAFYGMATPGTHFTIVMARQSDENAPPNAEPLPKDAAEYAYVGAYGTNTKAEE